MARADDARRVLGPQGRIGGAPGKRGWSRTDARSGSNRRSRLVTWISGAAALAMIATIAVVAAGYDARDTPREEPAVWAMRGSGQYARVNTLTAEIDTVRRVEEPSAVLQAGGQGVVLSHGNGRVWSIDPMLPQDLVEESSGGSAETADEADVAGGGDAEGPGGGIEDGTDGDEGSGSTDDVTPVSGDAGEDVMADRAPEGTRDTVVAGDAVLFRTDDGDAFLARFGDPATGTAGLGDPVLLDPFAEERAQAQREAEAEESRETDGDDADDGDGDGGNLMRFTADAVAADTAGRVALFSAAEGEIHWYDFERGEFVEVDRVPEGAGAENAQLAIVSGDWVLLESDSGRLWREGAVDPIEFELNGDALLQASSTADAGSDALVADGSGLWRIADGEAARVESAEGLPVQPLQVGEHRYAAWVSQAGGASMWSSEGGLQTLDLDEDVEIPGEPDPVFRSNGTSALLAEQQTGMMWTVPDGTLIPVEQWTLVDPPKERSGVVVVNDVTEQEPPVAVNDAFGVRAGEPAPLPVLLNDYDPNRRDVLTIVPDGIADGLDASFGTLSLLPDGQSLVVHPSPDAEGSATFSYRITDGINLSEPATVTLSVVDPGTNTAPQWCPVEACQRDWPSPEVAPGGTLVMPILEGWVDPEGDPMMLERAVAVNSEDPVRVLVTADGRFALRHSDPNAPDSDVVVQVTVADAHGETRERDLTVQIRSGARAEMAPIASTAVVDQPMTVRPLNRITGGSGSFALVDASVQSGNADVEVNVGSGSVEVHAKQEGVTVVSVTARDTGTDNEITGTLRITAVAERSKLGLPPLRAFVRPLADTTIDVLDAVPSANTRALVVRSATVVDGELRADVLEHAQVRVSGSTPDGAAGRIGSADILVEEGTETSTGRMTVFQVPESGDTGAIAVADNITVRAGSVAEVPVLDNDVAPPGQRLVLHPEIGGSGAEGELAFASGNTLRYLAPEEPGSYTVTYTTYGASTPEASDVGQVQVTVLPREGNRDPQPRALTVRLAPGEVSTVTVPLSGVDPDGDRVRLVGVTGSDDARLTASVVSRSSAVQIEASRGAQPGVQIMHYSVRDEFGGEAEGRLRVIVVEEDGSDSAPVAFSDYVRLVQGTKEPALVRPLDNDVDPSGGKLRLVEVVPNVPGGAGSAEYRRLADRLDTSELAAGRVVVHGSEELGTVSYRYTVRSSKTSSTTDGLIVVQVSARVGQQAPTVRDTVLSARDRAELERGGVDVVTDRVFWSAGDVSDLELSVWGRAADRFAVDGSRISGKYRAEGDLVPFRLAGEDLTGAEVESFGFLVIPPLDELRLTLRPGLAPLRVQEDRSVDTQIADIVDLADGDTVEFRTGAFPVQRGQAACEATSGSTLRYTAGRERPWSDTCLVSVKLTEQKAWTQLSVPIEIVPNEPVAELESLTRTVAPGATETIDLTDMVRWQGGREGDVAQLGFRVSGGGAAFETSTVGTQVTVQARADAVPGREDVLTVSVVSGDGSQASLRLRVGEAPRDTPRGASVSLECTVGSSCQAQVIGAPGEYDPFQGKSGSGLTLESVSGAGCAVATFQASGQSVTVGWPDGPKGSGGRCTATFSVRDAQNRTGQGRIELDAQGVPRPPTRVEPVSAGASSIAVSVALSGESSYPAVSGVELVTGDGDSVGSCSLRGSQATCTVTGLEPGERQTYFARAVNSAGASERSANGAETWAYVPPPPPSLSVTTVQWSENRDSSIGRVRVRVGDSSAATRVLSINGTETPITRDGVHELPAGQSHRFSVISADAASMIPPKYTGSDSGRGSANTESITPIGAPTAGSATLELRGERRTGWTISTSGFSENGGDDLRYTYAIGDYTGPNSSGRGLTEHEVYTGAVVAANSYGRTSRVTTNEETTGRKLPTLTGTYEVGRAATPNSGGLATWNPGQISWTPSPTGTLSHSDVTIASPVVNDVVQCATNGRNCSDPGMISPASGSPNPFSLQRPAQQIARGWGDPLPSENTIRNAFTRNGDPGIGLRYEVDPANETDVIVRWADNWSIAATFFGVVEVPDPPEEPDPGDSDSDGDADGAGDDADASADADGAAGAAGG